MEWPNVWLHIYEAMPVREWCKHCDLPEGHEIHIDWRARGITEEQMRKEGYKVMSKKTGNDDIELEYLLDKGKRQIFESGSQRQALDEVRYDLISPIGLKRLAQTCAEGARRYGDRNWEKGMPFSILLNHARDHINDFIAQQLDLGEELCISREDHLAHAVWNLMAIMHFQTTHPEMNDLRPSNKPGVVTAGKIDASTLTAMRHPNKHAFQGSRGVCASCGTAREHEIHLTDDKEEALDEQIPR